MPLLSPGHDRPELPADIQIGALAGAPPDLLEMYAYWQRKRGARAMPTRADIEPAEIKRLLPGVLLVDVRGENPVGKRVADAFFGPTLENVLGCYQTVVDHREPYLDDDYYLRDGDYFADEANIFLPLSNDGEHVNMILVYTAYRRVR